MLDVDCHAEFHRFPQLPPEIRDTIWSFCLPHRVREIDIPSHWIIFWRKAPSPCKLWDTTSRNTRPPLISRVCHDSRAIALKARAGMTFPARDESHQSFWSSGTEVRGKPWRDSTRDSPHLNWQPANSAGSTSYGSPLDRMAWEASRSSGRGSLMLGYFGAKSGYPTAHGRIPPPRLQRPRIIKRLLKQTQARDRDALKRLPSWHVVMRIIIIHSDFKSAAATGLFGLFGEEVVQVVDASNEQRCHDYYQLAETYEQRASTRVTVPQSYKQESLDAMRQRLKEDIMNAFDCEDLVKIMHPAIMFRLCTSRCNERELTESDDEDF